MAGFAFFDKAGAQQGVQMILDYNGKKIEVSQPTGNTGAWHVTVDNYFQGQIVKNNGVWTPYLEGTILTGDDISVIISLIKESEK